MEEVPAQRAPLVKGPFGPRLPVIHGLLPAWECYILFALVLVGNGIIVDVLVREYVLCPDRKDGYFNSMLQQYADTTVVCTEAEGLTVVSAVLVVFVALLCVFATREPYAKWKANGLEPPKESAITVGQEDPSVLGDIPALWAKWKRQKDEEGEDNVFIREQITIRKNVAEWPSLASWEKRKIPFAYGDRVCLGWVILLLTWAPALLLVYQVLSYDPSDHWGPERKGIIFGSDYGKPLGVETPSDKRDSAIVQLIVWGNMITVLVIGAITFWLSGASVLRKGAKLARPPNSSSPRVPRQGTTFDRSSCNTNPVTGYSSPFAATCTFTIRRQRCTEARRSGTAGCATRPCCGSATRRPRDKDERAASVRVRGVRGEPRECNKN